MSLRTRWNRDYYGGAFLVVVGVAAAYVSAGYRLGSLASMGPGYFPFAVGCLLALTGLLIAVSGGARGEPQRQATGLRHRLPDLRGGACLVLGVLAFVGLGEYFGLLPATFGIVFLSALGDRENTLREALALSAAMMVVAVVVFHWALQVQMPLVSWGA